MKENLGAFYDKSSDFQGAQYNTLIDMIGRQVPVGMVKNILDIGCGSGVRTKNLLNIFENCQHIYGIDPDWEMISVAQDEYNDPRITYNRFGAEQLSELKSIYPALDAVFANWSVHWVEDKDLLMNDINDVTAPGAYAMFSTCERLPEILVDIDQYIRAELLLPQAEASPWFYLTETQWEDLFKKHGWTMLEIKAFATDHHENDAQQYLQHWFAASTAKFLYGRQMEQISELAMTDLVWFMEQKYGGSSTKDEGLFFTEDVVFMVAQKD